MNWLDILYYALTALVSLSASIPFAIKLVKYIKAYKAAKTEAEKAQAANAIYLETKRLVAEAEKTYREIDAMLKKQGSTAGPLKYGYVINALKAFCLENGYACELTALSDAIKEEVAHTKTVNYNKTA
jgi:hypothetical protein